MTSKEFIALVKRVTRNFKVPKPRKNPPAAPAQPWSNGFDGSLGRADTYPERHDSYDPSVPGSVAWATKQQGLTPCPGCGLSMEGRTHGPKCTTGDITQSWGDEALDAIFRDH